MTILPSRIAPRVALGLCSVGLAAIVAISALWIFLSAPTPAKAEEADVSFVKAAALVQATSGSASIDMEAIGEQAKLINAALPFSRDPIDSARPFHLSGGRVDEKRALLCLTQAVYYEAGFEPVSGRRAVAQVVLNRLRHPAFPNSVCGVVYQGAGTGVCQFTFVCDGALYRTPEAAAWRQARAIAEAALSGYVEGEVGQATHYHADYVAPRWAPLLTKVTQIGAHIFYRWPGSWGRRHAFVARYVGEPSDPASLRPPPPLVSAEAGTHQVVEAGPPVRRAPNDVGGLLDTTKGWTLNIPDPRETQSASSRVLSKQAAAPVVPAAPVVVAAAAPAVTASR